MPRQQKTVPGRVGETILGKSDLASVSDEIGHAVETLRGGQDGGKNIILIMDQIDLLLATGGDHATAIEMGEMLLGLREVCHLLLFSGTRG